MKQFVTLVTFVVVVVISAKANLLRGDAKSVPTSNAHDDESRQLYGREYGFESFQSLFSEGNDEDFDSEPRYVGKPVNIDVEETSQHQQQGPEKRISGGEVSDPIRWFVMHLSYSPFEDLWRSAGCGGTLIGNCHVLTAAHCVLGENLGLPNGLYVNAYEPFLGWNGGRPFHFSRVESIDSHGDYDSTSRLNDIAIITLASCVDINVYKPVELATPAFLMNNVSNTDPVIAAGFGKLAANDTEYVETLRRVEMEYISRDVCNEYHNGKVLGDMFCAGVEGGGKDSCLGDSGGPLFMELPLNISASDGATREVQLGIVSWGTGCARPDKPGVYASVPYHYDWIQTRVCGYNDTDQSIPLCQDFDGDDRSEFSSNGNSDGGAETNFPSEAPSAFPSTAPAPSCSTVEEGECWSDGWCCSGLKCQMRDNKCYNPGGGKKEKARLHSRVGGGYFTWP